MELLPERSSQPRTPGKRDSGSGNFVEYENRSQPETNDKFQAWLLSLFDWEIDGICDPKWHASPIVSNPLDQEPLLPGNFSHSCRWYSIDSEGLLEAECQMLDGEYHHSAMGLKSIIMGLNGEFYWLDGTIRSPGCQKSDASDWCLLSRCEVEAKRPHPEGIGFPVIARCVDDDGEYKTYYLTLDERITNDNGRLKLVVPLGLLTIPPFTDYHVSTVAMAMAMGIQHRPPTVQGEDIESQVQLFLRSQYFAQSPKRPLAESLDAKAATLISLMWIRFCRTYTVDDLVMYSRICKAIYDRLRDERPPNHELKVLLDHYREFPSHLKRQVNALLKAANNRRQIFLINEAIHVLQMVQVMIAEDDKWMPFFKQELCKMVLFRYEAIPDLEDLQTACALAETFCATYAKDDVYKASVLMTFAKCKWEEDSLSGEQKNEQAIVDALLKAESCFTGLNRHIARQNLCTYRTKHLSTFEAFNSIELHHTIKLLNDVPADFAAEGQKVPLLDEIAYWRNRARYLCLAFQAKPEDSSLIVEAIDCAERSFSACKVARAREVMSDEIFADALATHAQALAVRFKISEASEDLDRIIEIYREALTTCGPISRGRADILHSLALHQLLWHERKGALKIYGDVQGSVDQALLDAFQNAKAAYDSPSKYSDAQGVYANTLILALVQRYGASMDSLHLDEAIKIAADSLATLPHKDSARTLLEATKCELLFQRFLLQPSAGSYDEAMDAAHRHSQRAPLETIDGPRQVIRMMRLAMKAFKMKANVLQEDLLEKDVSFVKQQCDQILNLDRTQARFRVEAGMMLGSLWSASKEWKAANKVLEKTIWLFKRLVTRSLSRDDQEWLLRQVSTGLPTIASFVALHAAEAAGSSAEDMVLSSLQHLESSRGMLARLVFESRLNLELFRSVDDNAAEEYDSLLNQLTLLEAVVSVDENQTSSINDNMRSASVIQRRAKIVERMSELEHASGAKMGDISVDVFKSLVGKSALVYVVANSDTAIALLVTGAGLRPVELQELKALDITEKLDRLYGNCRLSKAKPTQVPQAGRELREILKWLWDKAVKPILSALGYYPQPKRCHCNRLPRLWWCASGIMSKLPFHAAGEGAESANSENVYDYAVCSFTASLMALKMARDCMAPSERVLNDGMLAVSMPTTPGPGWTLLKAEQELELIKDAAGLNPTCLTNPTKLDVIKMLSEHSIIHFICHGISIANDPSSSALVLGHKEASAAERLTVKELGAISLKKARIAYLSACSTAENSSYELSDESIHLASAFQLAGFPHVIGAFWEAKERGAIPLAGLFYKNLAGAVAELNLFESSHDIVAYALHDALCEVRKNTGSRNPLCWAPFVHIGA